MAGFFGETDLGGMIPTPLGLDLLKEPATHNANRFLVKGESATYSTFHDIKGVGRVCEAANPRFSSAARAPPARQMLSSL